MDLTREIKDEMTAVMLEIPVTFTVSGRKFRIYPMTLGQRMMTESQLSSLGLNYCDDMAEAVMKACGMPEHRKGVTRILSICTMRRKMDLTDVSRVTRRAGWLGDHLTDSELTELFMLAMSLDNTELYKRHLGLTEEAGLKNRLSAIRRERRSSLTFGGRSMWGTMIDFACERYGWTLQYVLWGVSYANLVMMTADIFASVPLDGEEVKRLHIGEEVIKADDPANRDRIREMLKDS